jgi:hypothetical protein
MKNIHILPTDKLSRLFIIDGTLYNYHKPQQGDGVNEINQHIYITNSEEIKEGDYVYSIKQGYNIQKVPKGLVKSYQEVEHYKKIILTTDHDLINDGIQPIDDTFLQWFVKNPSCEKVEVIRDRVFRLDEFNQREFYDNYKIIIPQEEPKQEMPIINGSYGCIIETNKQETLEESAERFYSEQSKAYEDAIEPIFDNSRYLVAGFKEGAKFQAKRMYSEAIEFAEWIRIKDFRTVSKNNWIGLDMKYYTTQELFVQFKKK